MSEPDAQPVISFSYETGPDSWTSRNVAPGETIELPNGVSVSYRQDPYDADGQQGPMLRLAEPGE